MKKTMACKRMWKERLSNHGYMHFCQLRSLSSIISAYRLLLKNSGSSGLVSFSSIVEKIHDFRKIQVYFEIKKYRTPTVEKYNNSQ